MTPHLPFKADNFASWTAPKLLPVVPTIADITSSSNGNSNMLLYVGLGVLTIAVIAGTVYLVNQNNEFRYQLADVSFEIKKLSALKAQEQTSNHLITDSKTNQDGSTT